MADQRVERQVPWLPNERFELALDPKQGALTRPTGTADVLTITSLRAIRMGGRTGRRTTSVMTLSSITGVEVVDFERPAERLTQGLAVLGIGLIIAWITWMVFATALITLLLGGVPVLVGVYLLAGYAFPDDDGELVLHAPGQSIRQPLLTPDARGDAYLVAHRVFELAAAGPDAAPSADAAPTATPDEPPAPVPEVPRLTPQPAPESWVYRSQQD